MAELFRYQAEGVDFMRTRKRAFLWDTPGLGKTPQAIRAMDAYLGKRTGVVVIVCPASLVTNWQREIARWRCGLWSHVVVSYDKLVRGVELPREITGVIADEHHYCKSPGAKRTKATLELVARAEVAYALSGTPMPNGPWELFAVLRAFAPEVIKGKTGKLANYGQFLDRWCVTVPNPWGHYPKPVGTKNGPELKARLAPFFVRRTKAQVLKDLPPLVENNLYVDVPPDGSAAVKKLETEIGGETLQAVLDGNLRAIAHEHIARLRRLTGTLKAGAVAKIVTDELEDGLEKIVVFAHHKDALDILEGALRPFGIVRLDGSTTPHNRQAAVDAFQVDDGIRVFLSQMTSGGVGITLTAASNIVFAEMDWVPASVEQAKQRIHRIGQTESCLVRYAVLPGSLDEQMVAVLRRKMSAIGQVLS
jgi:SWI/SNF-related matrix-associated actin-dependent regulator 1 of chromatin subfamily A